MRRIGLLSACLVLLCGPLGAAEPVETIRTAAVPGLAERAGLDQVLARFGESLALSVRQQGVTDAGFLAVWESATREAFGRGGLDRQLSAGLAEALDERELASIEQFLVSPLGSRVTALEAAVNGLPSERQIAAIAKGQVLLLGAAPGRRSQIEEILSLSNAELTFGVIAESLRGAALGLHLAANGDIAVPWEEIDAVVEDALEGLEQGLTDASLAVMAYTFDALTEAELEAYLGYLRAPETQKFQILAAYLVGTAIHEAMETLSADVVRRLQAVSI